MSKPSDGTTRYELRKKLPPGTLLEISMELLTATIGYRPKGKAGPLQGDTVLVVPITVGGVVTSIEMIDGGGRKSFLAHGVTKGGWWSTQELPDSDGTGLSIYVGEGIATTKAAGGIGVAALMDSNLPAVARMLRNHYPAGDICILADLLPNGTPNHHAVKAAQESGGRLFVPNFGPDRQPDQKDANDLFCLLGPEETARQLANAKRVEPEAATQTAPKAQNKPTPFSMRELLAQQFDPVEFVISGLLAQGVYRSAYHPTRG
ncbi:MAG: hypothetical protein H7836_09450 [Magnetococcus sp. YQC-3]